MIICWKGHIGVLFLEATHIPVEYVFFRCSMAETAREVFLPESQLLSFLYYMDAVNLSILLREVSLVVRKETFIQLFVFRGRVDLGTTGRGFLKDFRLGLSLVIQRFSTKPFSRSVYLVVQMERLTLYNFRFIVWMVLDLWNLLEKKSLVFERP